MKSLTDNANYNPQNITQKSLSVVVSQTPWTVFYKTELLVCIDHPSTSV